MLQVRGWYKAAAQRLQRTDLQEAGASAPLAVALWVIHWWRLPIRSKLMVMVVIPANRKHVGRRFDSAHLHIRGDDLVSTA